MKSTASMVQEFDSQAVQEGLQMEDFSADVLHKNLLNNSQTRAVVTTEGPLLVLAGAGTGKTRVLTTRLAHILQQGLARPHEILSVTFTNKAASQMRERLSGMIGPVSEQVWLGTFHSLSLRILRRNAELAGRKNGFTILDSDDQLRLVKQLVKAEGFDEKKFTPRAALYYIGRWKDRALLPDQVGSSDGSGLDPQGGHNDPALHIYTLYQERLKILNAVDFGDIILLTLNLLRNHPEVLSHYHTQFKYILVDEYQDTNVSQYLWLRLLAQVHKNICCVGDDDQSIYGWRGAEVTNILRFEDDFPGATVIRLEENYRSTPHILGAASGLISHNKSRHGKTLWTQKDEGYKVRVKNVWDGDEEARFVADEVESLQRQKKRLQDMAILVRAAYQTREFEDRFLSLGIPYKVVGGLRFYERQEIRDALAYLRVVHSPSDSLAFERIINTPRRGIGASTVQLLHQYARDQQIPLSNAAETLIETDEIRGKARSALRSLLADIARWRSRVSEISLEDLTKIILDESGYSMMWLHDKSPEAPGRLENLKEFVMSLRDYDSLESFLEHVSLVVENAQGAALDREMVTLMTLHSAKGLEFEYVFLTGWEEGVFPNQRSLLEGGLEEERRLAYVGITRAKTRAFISYAHNRRIHGSWEAGVPSRFIGEIPDSHKEVDERPGMGSNRPFAYTSKIGYGKNSYGDQAHTHEKSMVGNAPAKISTGYQIGERVFHMKFGYGVVRDVNGDKLVINFEHSGQKHVVGSFVKKSGST